MPHKLLLPWSASTWQHRAEHENWWKMVKPSESYNIYYNFSETLKELGHWIRKWHEITLNTDNQLILDIQTIGLDQSIGVLDFWMMTRPDAVPPFLLHQFHPMEIPLGWSEDVLISCPWTIQPPYIQAIWRGHGDSLTCPMCLWILWITDGSKSGLVTADEVASPVSSHFPNCLNSHLKVGLHVASFVRVPEGRRYIKSVQMYLQ